MQELYDKLSQSITDMEEDKARRLAEEIVSAGLPLDDAIEYGIVAGMEKAGELFENEEYFITELLLCADASGCAMEVFAPFLQNSEKKSKGRIIIGSIFGDTHDIGKNIVALMLSGSGFDVLDLGRDVSAGRFVSEAISYHADIIAISTLMTTTMNNMKDVVDLLVDQGVRDRFTVIIGGMPCSKSFSRRIGADDYSASAAGAVRLVKRILAEKAGK